MGSTNASSGPHEPSPPLCAVDIASLLRAAEIISRQVQPAALVDRILRVLMASLGATRGVFIQSIDGELWVQATRCDEATASAPRPTLLSARADDIACSVVHHVARARQPLVLHDAPRDQPHAADPHIVDHAPRSVLCFPVVRHEELRCILYFEHARTIGAFTPDRVELLRLLHGQIATSLDNARLYQDLETRVGERTHRLERAHARILSLEKETLERQMAGGFAHEMRNAISAASMALRHSAGTTGFGPGARERLAALQAALGPLLSERARDVLTRWCDTSKRRADKLDRALRLAQESNDRALAVTTQILEYSRLGRSSPGHDPLALGSLIQSVLDGHRDDFEDQRIVVSLTIRGNDIIEGSATHFHSIFGNVIDNAHDALLTSPHERELLITVTARDDDHQVTLDDSGPGISAPDLEHVFEPFFSRKPTTGTGLGLSFARKLLSLYDGHITIEPRQAGGTRVTIVVPRRPRVTPP